MIKSFIYNKIKVRYQLKITDCNLKQIEFHQLLNPNIMGGHLTLVILLNNQLIIWTKHLLEIILFEL